MKSKIRTMKSRESVSDDEIRQYMDFDELLAEKDKLITRQKKIRVLRNTGIGVVGLFIVAGLIYFTFDSSSGDSANQMKKENTPEISASIPQTVGPDSVKHFQEVTPQALTPSHERAKSKHEKATKLTTQNKSTVEIVPDPKTGEAIYVQSEPVNGYPELYAYFDRELIYPKEAVKDSIQGVVTVIFSINTNGLAEKIQIENSLGNAFDREVYRVMEKMPAWKPATYNGKPVRSKVSLPLTFQLQKIKK
jgi:TonB family protein